MGGEERRKVYGRQKEERKTENLHNILQVLLRDFISS